MNIELDKFELTLLKIILEQCDCLMPDYERVRKKVLKKVKEDLK